ncbi:hypothetical protein OVY48_21985 [Sphingobium sp. SA2]|uniref:hypothetical protein n=1 Tax=Sphingobium sp. SA2 TaxID=1524832 RepID=UPI0028C363D4|nr:hypothetical protein [Sphingobium sp. SA2]MDT7536072.1 hypothetical protein [Sphingobium sp. SA2]
MAMPIGYADVTRWPVVRIEDGVEAGREDPHPTSPVKTGEGKRIVGASKALERLGHVAGDAGGYQLRKVA